MASYSILTLNQSWLKAELTALGHRVVCAGSGGGGYDVRFPVSGCTWKDLLAKLPEGFIPDRVVYFDDSRAPSLLGLEELNVPSIFYSVDAHHHHAWHTDFSALFDGVLVAQQDYVKFFEKAHPFVRWFPLWTVLRKDPIPSKTIDVCFRGTFDRELHPKRTEFFELLTSLVEVDVNTGPYEEPYTRSKIVVNETVKDDMNFRVFEALGCGAMLVTPRTGNGLLDLFQDGVDIVTYERDHARDAAEKIQYYLAHEDERARIANSGFEKVRSLHTSVVRAQELVRILSSLDRKHRPDRVYRSALTYLVDAQVARKSKSEHALDSLHKVASLLKQSADSIAAIDERFQEKVIMVRAYLEEAQELDAAGELVGAAHRRLPNDPILAIAQIVALRRAAKRDVAYELAKQFSDKPEELLEDAKRLLREIDQQILSERCHSNPGK